MQFEKEQCIHHHLESDLKCKRNNPESMDCIDGSANYFQLNLNLINKNKSLYKTQLNIIKGLP